MKILKNRPIFLRIYLIMLVCLSFGIYPAYKCMEDSECRIGKLDMERRGAKMLNSIATIAHGAYLRQTGSSLYGKSTGEFAAAVKNIAALGKAFLEMPQSGDIIKKSFAAKNLVSRRILDSFFESKEKGVMLADMCRFAMFQGELFTDANPNSHILMKVSGEDFPRIYAGIYKISYILAYYGDLGDKKAASELLKSFAVLDEYTRSMQTDLRRIVSTSASRFSGSMATAIVKLNACEGELSSSLSKIWASGASNMAQAQTSLDNFEKAASDLWLACAENLSNSIADRHIQSESELKIFQSIVIGCAFLSILISIFVLQPLRKFWRDMAAILRMALSGKTREAMEKCDMRRRDSSEFSNLTDDIAGLIEKYVDTQERAELAEGKISEIRGEAISIAQSQQPVLDNLASSIRLASERYSAYAAGTSASVHSVASMRDDASAAEQSIRSKIKALSELSTDLRDTAGRVDSLARSLEDARSTAEKMTNVVETFTGVADQANILSLNLSIAAAKAGMKLSGMGTLAEQIRLLSRQITVSVLDIEGIRDAVIGTLNAGVKSSEFAAELLEGNVKISDDVNAALDIAMSSLSSIAASANSISSKIRDSIGADAPMQDIEQSMESISSAFSRLSSLRG